MRSRTSFVAASVISLATAAPALAQLEGQVATGYVEQHSVIYSYGGADQRANDRPYLTGSPLSFDIGFVHRSLQTTNRSNVAAISSPMEISGQGRAQAGYARAGGAPPSQTYAFNWVSAGGVATFNAPTAVRMRVTMSGNASRTAGGFGIKQGWAEWQLDGIQLGFQDTAEGVSAPYALTADLVVPPGDHTLNFRAWASTDFNNNSGDNGATPQDITVDYDFVATFEPYVATGSAPVAYDGNWETRRGEAVDVALVATDDDAGTTLSYRVVGAPANGTLSGTGASRRYVPRAGFTGADSFTFVASDGERDSNPATIRLQVVAPPTATRVKIVGSNGMAAPGFPAGTTLIITPYFPRLSAGGRIVVAGQLTGGGATSANDAVLFTGPPSALQLLAREGDQVRGAQQGVRYGELQNTRTLIAGNGRVAMFTFTNGGVLIAAGHPGNVTKVAAQNDRAPGTNGATFGSLQLSGIADDGRVLMQGYLQGGDTNDSNSQGIWIGRTYEDLELVARGGMSAPGIPGATYRFFNGVGMGAGGHVVFTSYNSDDRQALFAGLAGAVSALVVTNSAPPGLPGWNVQGIDTGFGFGEGSPASVSAAGRIAFSIYATDPSGQFRSVILTGPIDGAMTVGAAGGLDAPGGGRFQYFQRATVNDAGVITFTGASDTLGQAIWAGTPGALRLLAREGGVPAGREQSTYRGFNPPFVNARGDIAYRALFNDTEGVMATVDGAAPVVLLDAGDQVTLLDGSRHAVDSESFAYDIPTAGGELYNGRGELGGWLRFNDGAPDSLYLIETAVAPQQVNQPPIARDDTASADAGTASIIAVLANDEDPEGGALTVTAVGAASQGVTELVNGQVRFTSTIDAVGLATFEYTVADAAGLTAVARVTVMIQPADLCPNDPSKVVPGICGCDVSDADSDGDGRADCQDACPADRAKTAPGECGCGVPDEDTDRDGTLDCRDGCAGDPAKVVPGACGCNVADEDTDRDGTLDCNDGCKSDPGKVAPGVCGCGVADTDGDRDGSLDCNDGCPADAAKTGPGICGCNVSDADGDGDGTANCRDGCPNDAGKTGGGVCGCGTPDTDSDRDGTPDCHDGCPNDGAKTAAGLCGCGVADTDTDHDGTPNCQDACPANPSKTAPGVCGCEASDLDSDRDGRFDCQDNCRDVANADQRDTNGDGEGDACDPDDDGDGRPDAQDNCPLNPNASQSDEDRDRIGDACDAHFDPDSVSVVVGDTARSMIAVIDAVPRLPGANGLVAKLNEIISGVSTATAKKEAGTITLAQYRQALTDALDSLTAFDNQERAKARNGQLPAADAARLEAASAQLRALLQLLLARAGAA